MESGATGVGLLEVPVDVMVLMCLVWLPQADVVRLRRACAHLARAIPVVVAESKAQRTQDLCFAGKLHALRLRGVTAEEVRDGTCFVEACAGGSLAVAQWLADQCGFDVQGEKAHQALQRASEGGHLEVVKWLTCRPDFGRGSHTTNNFALRSACAKGHLEVAVWLAEHLRIQGVATKPRSPHASFDSRGALVRVCEQGHQHVAVWLAQHYAMTAMNAQRAGTDAMRWACRRGHLRVAQWAAAHFRLTRQEARLKDNSALRWACAHGRVDVVQWLVTHFALTADDVAANDYDGLHWACNSGHLDVVRWLVARFGLAPPNQVPPWHGEAILSACERDRVHVVQWLLQLYHIKRRTIRRSIRKLALRCGPRVDVWLRTGKLDG